MTPQDSSTEQDAYGARRIVGLLLGPLLMVLMLLLPAPDGLSAGGWHTAAVAVLMAVWWITEALPIPATSLLPLVFFPILGAGTIRESATPYANPLIFLFLGGFLIATAMQRWGLHTRIALRIIRLMGTGPRALVAGFMVAAAFLSMWVSNTATAMMMLPIGLSVVQLAEEAETEDLTRKRFALALLLGIAYGCNIGGMATLIGTPPNALLAGFIEEQYGQTISFADWLGVGLSLVAVGLPLTFLVLTRIVFPLRLATLPGGRALIEGRLARLGRMSSGERWVALVFVLTALLWIIRPVLEKAVPTLSDAGIAMAGGLVLFMIPINLKRGVFVHSWESARRLPWGTLLLFGGGLSLAAAFVRTGLSTWIGDILGAIGFLPVLVVLLIIVAVIVLLTELTSNTATTAAFLPVLAALAVGIGQNPLLLTIPAVLGASCAFMLPVATPPNAIVHGSGRISIPQMAKAGIWLNVLFLLLITALAYTLVLWVFDVHIGVIPAWVR
ncbi:MAG: SLC13 family permease [Rhodothermales bacterium]